MFAVAVAPALAAPEFKASAIGKEYTEAEPGTTRGLAVEEAEPAFDFGGLVIKCPKAVAKGQVTSTFSKTLATEVKFSGCSTVAKEGPGKELLLATVIKTPVFFVFHANGFAETGAELGESNVEISGGTVEMKVAGVRAKCVIGWPAQTIPVRAERKPEEEFSAVEYVPNSFPRPFSKKAFPSGFQERLLVVSDLKSIKWEVAEGCENFEKTEGKGKYTGTLEEQVVGGNLEIV
jgi:hypothetical protein